MHARAQVIGPGQADPGERAAGHGEVAGRLAVAMNALEAFRGHG